jgi:hypothetical protein
MNPRKPRYRHAPGEPLELHWDETPDEWYCHGHVTKEQWLESCLFMVNEHFVVDGNDPDNEPDDPDDLVEVSTDPRDWVIRHVWARWEICAGDTEYTDDSWYREFREYRDRERGAFPVTCGTPVDWLVEDQNDRIDREVQEITEARLLESLFPGAEVRTKPWTEARYPGWFGWAQIEATDHGRRYVVNGNSYGARICKGDIGYWLATKIGRV